MKIFWMALLLLLTGAAFGGDTFAARSTFEPDPAKLDIYYSHLRRLPLSGWWKLKRVSNDRQNRPDDPGQTLRYYAADFDDSGWEKDLVPNDIHLPFLAPTTPNPKWDELLTAIPRDIREWGGVVYFRKDFTAPAMTGNERAILFLDEVAGAFTLYVNGQKMTGEQPYVNPSEYRGPQKRYAFDVTPAIRPSGKNNITIRLFNSGEPVRWGWAGRAGILDRVYLDIRPAAYTAEIMVTPQADLQSAEFDCVVSGSDAAADLAEWRGEIFEWQSGKTVGTAVFGGQTGQNGLRLISGRGKIDGATPWSWETPFLYGIRVKNKAGEVTGVQRFGMRTIGVKNGDFVLNNRPVMLRGVCFGSDDILREPGGFFAARTNYGGVYRREWEMYTQANLNFWRMHSDCRAYFEVADELGVIINFELVYPETRIQLPERADLIDVKGFDGACDAKGNLRSEFRTNNLDLLRNLYSHPSVGTFSFGNEIRQYDDPRVSALLNHLYELFHEADKQQRPVTNSSGRFWKDASNVAELAKLEKLDYIDTHDYTGSINNVPLRFCEPVIRNFAKAVERSYGNNAPPVINGETVYMASHYFPAVFDGIWKSPGDPQPDWDKMLYMLNQWYKDAPQSSFLSYYWVRNWGSKNYKYDRETGRGIYLERIIEAQRKSWPLQDGYTILSGPYFSRSGLYPFEQVTFTPNSSYRYLAAVNAPVIAVLDYLPPNRFTGERLSSKLTVVNNRQNQVKNLVWEAVLEQDGAAAVLQSIAVGDLEFGAKKEFPVTLAMPDQAGSCRLISRLRAGAQVVSEREMPLYLRSHQEVFQALAATKKVALYDASAVFGGLKSFSTVKVLKKFGIPFTALSSFENLAAYDVVVIGNNSIDAKVEEGADQLRAFVENGGRLLVFDQNYIGRIPFLAELEYGLAGPGQFSEILQADHPALRQLTQNNFFCWSQDDWSVYRTYISPVSRAALLLGGDTSQWGSDHFGMVAAHLKLGKGDMLFCQAEVTLCMERDSGAAWFARRLLETILDDSTRASAAPFTGFAVPQNKPLASDKAAFVSLKAAANMGFADETAKDGKGGWTDQGPTNDLSGFPVGRVNLGRVPFDIISPADNRNLSCVVVSGDAQRKLPAKSKPIAVSLAAKRLIFIHAGAWTPDDGRPIGQYIVTYQSGKTAVISLQNHVNISDWWSAPTQAVSQAACVWSALNRSGVVGVYLYEWINPHPEDPIANVVLESQSAAIIGLVGLTAEK